MHYGINYDHLARTDDLNIIENGSTRQWNESVFPEPAKFGMIAEVANDNGSDGAVFNAWREYGSATSKPVNDRHLEGANYAFLDGHAKWLSKATTEAVFAAQNTKANGQGINSANAGDYPIVFVWALN